MKCQDLFSLKNNKKHLECCLLQFLLGALRANVIYRGYVKQKRVFKITGKIQIQILVCLPFPSNDTVKQQ